jgi:hypothetical protein
MGLVLPLVLALTGCGSTALRQGAAPSAEGLNGGDGLELPTGAATPGGSSTGGLATGTSGTTGLGATGGAAGPSAPGVGQPGGTGGGSTSGTSTTGGATSGGKTATSTKPIKVGVIGVDAGALGAIFGVKARQPLDGPKAFVNGMNKAGGIGGRKIDPVYYVVDASSDASTSAQEACAAFTEDNKVDVVVGGGGEVLSACLARRGIATFDAGFVSSDAQAMSAQPNVFQPAAMRIDRLIRGTMMVGAGKGLLKSGTRLGVLVEDCPAYKRVANNIVLPMAKQNGVSVTQGTFRCVTNLVGDLVPVTNDVQRETLRFSSAGVSTVLIVSPTEAFALSNFTKTAKQQNYHPKYLITSNAYPYGNSRDDAAVKISDDALPNIVGAGYLPLLDLGYQARAANAGQQAARTRCDKIDPTQGGADQVDGDKSFAINGFYAACEAWFSMKGAVESNGMRFGYRDIATGFSSFLRSGAASAVLSGGRYGGGAAAQRDGAGYVVPFTCDAGKHVWHYVGNPVAVP